MKHKLSRIAAIATALFGLLSIAAAQPPIHLAPNDTVDIHCDGSRLRVSQHSRTQVTIKCLPVRGATATPEPSATPGDPPHETATPTTPPQPTATATEEPQATATPTQAPPSGDLSPVSPDILGTCSAEVHDRYAVTGPDGKLYRTWHPQTVPVDPNNPNGATCRFAHEHGADPTTSLADPSLPAFNYVALQGGKDEPHQGFKVFVANEGTRNDEGRRAVYSTRIVAHMGTGGPKRFSTQFHSLEFDLTGGGYDIHVQGMSDTGSVGGICQTRVGKTVVSLGCPDIQSLYEIWEMKLRTSPATIIVSIAAFDPATALDPSDPNRLLYTWDAFPRLAGNDLRGCDRESYSGPVYVYDNAGTFYTDAFGQGNGPVKQIVSGSPRVGLPMSNDGQTQFKYRQDFCGSGLSPLN